MSNQKQHNRTSSQGRKVLPPHAKPSRPPPLRRGHSYNHAPTHGQSGSSRLGPGWSKKTGGVVTAPQDEEDAEGMASFLQFCATCERQIVSPGTSILYCSEVCRKQDVTDLSPLLTSHSPPLGPSAYSIEAGPGNIVPQRSPTVFRPLSSTFSDLSIDDAASSLVDDDSESRDGQADSEYLSQFRSGTWNTGDSSAYRPRTNRASTATDDGGIPSLIHSPSSSLASNASFAPTRPRPSRHNKSYSTYSTPSVDLVTPCMPTIPPGRGQAVSSSMKSSASTLTSFRVAEGTDMSYESRRDSRRISEAEGSLKQLFSHEAMKAPPSEAPRSWRS